MDTLVLHLGGRVGKHADSFRSAGDDIAVGRGWNNDVILSDVHIAAEQLRFYKEGDSWHVQVLDITNTTYLNGEPVIDTAVVQSGDRLAIGRVQLGVYSPEHPVAPPRRYVISGWFSRLSSGIAIPLILLTVVCVVELLIEAYTSPSEPEWGVNGAAVISGCFVIFLWAGSWALAGRIFRQQGHFGAHLLAVVLVSGASMALVPLVSVIEFNSHSLQVGKVGYYLLALVLLALLFKTHFAYATHIRQTWIAGLSVSLILTGAYGAIDELSVGETFQVSPEYSAVVKPPALKLAPSDTVEGYLARLEAEMQFDEEELE